MDTESNSSKKVERNDKKKKRFDEETQRVHAPKNSGAVVILAIRMFGRKRSRINQNNGFTMIILVI